MPKIRKKRNKNCWYLQAPARERWRSIRRAINAIFLTLWQQVTPSSSARRAVCREPSILGLRRVKRISRMIMNCVRCSAIELCALWMRMHSRLLSACVNSLALDTLHNCSREKDYCVCNWKDLDISHMAGKNGLLGSAADCNHFACSDLPWQRMELTNWGLGHNRTILRWLCQRKRSLALALTI